MKKSMLGWSALALCAGAAFAQDTLTTWGKAKEITINTSATGVGLVGNTTNFPLLIRLDSTQAEVFAESKAGGADLRFRRVGGPALAYHIASWDSAARKAMIWVSVDTIFANNATQQIRMYWQKPSATSTSSAAAVFSAAKGFVAAWDMGGATGPRVNYVAGGMTARPMNDKAGGTFTGRSVPGVIGTADSLAGGIGLADSALGGGEFFDVSPMPAFEGGFTFSFWAKVTSTTDRTWMRFFDFGNGEAMDNLFAGRVDVSTDVRFDVLPTGLTLPSGLVANQWKHYVFTADGATGVMEAFLDGASQGIMEGGFIPAAERAASFLGKSNWAGDAYFTGLMDEVQVSNVARNQNWAKLAFETQRPGSNVLTWGTSHPGTPVAPGFAARGLKIRRQGAGYVIDLPSSGEARLSITDMSGRQVWSRTIGRSERTAVWNGTTASGAAAARGTYLARLEVSGQSAWEGTIAHMR